MAEEAAAPEEEQTPALSEEEADRLRLLLAELRNNSVAAKAVKQTREEIQAEAIPLLRKAGSMMISTPKGPAIANVRAAEILEVDAAELYAALLEHFGDADQAEMVWQSVLKPPAVDTKDDGLFHEACKKRNAAGELDEENGTALIPVEVQAKVARFSTNAPFIGFAKPGG